MNSLQKYTQINKQRAPYNKYKINETYNVK